MSIDHWIVLGAAAAITVLVAVVAVVAARRRNGAAVAGELASRPAALAGAKLLYMEKQFRIRGPVPLVARVDRAYRDVDGALVPVELKTRWRNRPYLTDVIQLSVQRMVIEGQTGQRVATHGFVTIQRPRGPALPRSHRVELMGAPEVVALNRRREDIIGGATSPRYASSRSACKGCAFRSRCDRGGESLAQ